ncbi:hypothetical protein [Aurantimonas endophytica]|uniref:AsmA-like protein n=1 Tax=Aurantimonas endophytica TaxID=1522175 RepID=A0A7W6HAS9_9HYPH|nr:hypothetical protein [Aurantimonas endophytica]MBB4001651.1 hypothetical protein [Aurantimonas endophytica]MCO6402712.1 hypothetical protein [Aurantimonas endophytica]
MRRAVRLMAGVASFGGILLVVAAGAIGLLLWTDTGRELLEAQTERIVSTALGPDFIVEMDRQRVGFDPNAGLGLRFADVTLRDRDSGAVMATAQQIGVGIGLGAIFTDGLVVDRVGVSGVRIAPEVTANRPSGALPTPAAVFAALDRSIRDIDQTGLRRLRVSDLSIIDAPEAGGIVDLTIRKTADGHFTLETSGTFGGQDVAASGEAQLDAAGQSVTALSFETSRVTLGTATRKPSAEPPGPELDIPATLRVTMRTDAVGRQLDATIAMRDGTFTGRQTVQIPSGSVTLVMKESGDEIVLQDGAFDFGDAHAEFGGRIHLVADENGALPVQVATTRLTSTVGSETGEVRSAAFDLAGRVHPTTGGIDLERLALKVGAGELSGHAEVSGFEATDRLELKMVARDLTVPDVKAFWPFFLADGARNWVLAHLEADGTVTSGSVGLDLGMKRLAAIMTPDTGPTDEEFQLALDLEGVSFRTIGEMPTVEAASGRIEAKGSTTVVSIESAALRDEAKVALMPSSIEFGRTDEGTVALLSLNLAGDATALVGLANREPVRALRQLDWRADEVSGRAELGVGVAFHLPRPPLRADLAAHPAPSPVRLESWSVVADLDSVELKRKIAGHAISAVSGIVSLAPGSAIGEVDALVDGVPATINFSQPLAPNPVGEPSLTLTASLEGAEVKALLPKLGEMLDGPVSARLTRSGERFIGSVDLGSARLSVPTIGWSKGPGVPATLDFELAMEGDRIVLPTAELKGEGFSAQGTVEADSAGLRRLDLKRASFNRDDSVAATIERSDSGYAIAVSGSSLDARAMLGRLKTDWSGSSGGGSAGNLTVSVKVDRLLGFDGEELRDAAISYRNGGRGGLAASLTGTTPRGNPVNLTIEPGEQGRAIRLDAGDAGALLRFAGLYKRMAGGSLGLRLTGNPEGRISGPLQLRDFTLVDEPRLASLVGTSRADPNSLAGALGRDLEVSQAYFDTASMGLSWDGSRLVAYDGILRGPIFGSSFEGVLYDTARQIDMSGSFMPAYGVNRLFGAIPFVGGILGNGAEGGLIGITYRLAGPFGDPTLAVNPISAIAPGIFRRIFEY